MGVRATTDPGSGRPQSPQAAEGRSSIEIFDDLAAAAPLWRQLETAGALWSAYQRHAWMQAWQRHVGTLGGVALFLVAGLGAAGEPVFLWPLGFRRLGPLRVARFLGGKHANLNLPLWDRDAAAATSAADLEEILGRLARMAPRVDLLVLQNQPRAWNGVANPFAALPHQPSPSPAYRGSLQGDFEAVLRERIGSETRRKLRQKERALARRGKFSCWHAADEASRRVVLEAFFAQKADRMRELGLDDAFAEPGVRAFLEHAATEADPATGLPPVELYACTLDDDILATFGGTAAGGRFSGMFNSMTSGPLAGDSPGEVLLAHVVRVNCERGFTCFDLGVGDASYKRGFCNETEPLFDSVIGLTPLGKAAAPVWRAGLAAKAALKASPLWERITAAKRRRGKAARRSAG